MTTRMRQAAFDFNIDSSLPRSRKNLNTDNVYIALKPCTQDALCIGERVGPACRMVLGDIGRVKPSRFHVTLCGIGTLRSLPARFDEAIERRMHGISAASIAMRFDRISDFGGNAVVLRGGPVEPVKILRRLIMKRLASSRRFASQSDVFEPHLTVWYSLLNFPERPIEPVCWTATEIVLVHSFHGHRILRRWPLTGPADIYDRLLADARMADLFDERPPRSDHT